MALLEFQKPEKVTVVSSDTTQCKVELKPLEPGYGVTVGNALRRVLLSSLEGYAFSSIKIEGVGHEFATIPGVMEDVCNIILNLKKVRLKKIVDVGVAEEVVSIKLTGKKELRAGDFNDFLNSFEVLNKDLLICSMDEGVVLEMTLTLTKGRGYVPAAEQKKENAPIGTIMMDSIYTPIRNVKYAVDSYRVGQRTDYELLELEVATDGSIDPSVAIQEASQILMQHLVIFGGELIVQKEETTQVEEPLDDDTLKMRQLLNSKLNNLGFSVRALNCLRGANVFTLAELVQYKETELIRFRNFGKKSLSEIKEKIDEYGLTLGLDVTKYRLEELDNPESE